MLTSTQNDENFKIFQLIVDTDTRNSAKRAKTFLIEEYLLLLENFTVEKVTVGAFALYLDNSI